MGEVQWGFLIDGAADAPLRIMDAVYSEAANEGATPAHVAFLDMMEAYPSVTHPTLDVAMARIGAPESVIEWLRQTLHRQTRRPTVGSENGATGDTFELHGSLPQGCVSSPVLWCIVYSCAQEYVRQVGAAGYKIGDVAVQQEAYADDTALVAPTSEELTQTAQALVDMLTVMSIRLNSKKSFYAASNGDGIRTLEVWALNGTGKMELAKMTPVPAKGMKPGAEGPASQTEAQQGHTMYLGVRFSHRGAWGDESRWGAQERAAMKKATAFLRKAAEVAPDIKQYRRLCNGLLTPQMGFALTVMPLTEAVEKAYQASVTAGAVQVLRRQQKSDRGITTHVILSSTEVGGVGVNDIPATAATTEARMITLGANTPNPTLRGIHQHVMRQISQVHEGGVDTEGYVHAAARTKAMAKLGIQMHAGGQGGRAQDMEEDTEEGDWAKMATANINDTQRTASLRAMARIVMATTGTLFRALREEERDTMSMIPYRHNELKDTEGRLGATGIMMTADPFAAMFYALRAKDTYGEAKVVAVRASDIPAATAMLELTKDTQRRGTLGVKEGSHLDVSGVAEDMVWLQTDQPIPIGQEGGGMVIRVKAVKDGTGPTSPADTMEWMAGHQDRIDTLVRLVEGVIEDRGDVEERTQQHLTIYCERCLPTSWRRTSNTAQVLRGRNSRWWGH